MNNFHYKKSESLYSSDNATDPLKALFEALERELASNDEPFDIKDIASERARMIADDIWSDCTKEHASQVIKEGVDFSYKAKDTNYTLFHIAAAMGRRDLFDLFCEAATPDMDAVDFMGRTAGDVAMILADDADLCEHINRTYAKIKGLQW